jgi:DNA-binding MarR family transcriptional regulator
VSPNAKATVNVLGALALAVNDQVSASVLEESGQSESAAAALSALEQFLDRPTIDQLRQVLGLTPSGAVRLVDRLSDAGLVVRGAGANGRSRSVALTTKGHDIALRIASAREIRLGRLVAGLTTDETDTLHSLLGRVMSNVVDSKDGGAWVCRLCDLGACGRAAGLCPTANAASVKYADRQARGLSSRSGPATTTPGE